MDCRTYLLGRNIVYIATTEECIYFETEAKLNVTKKANVCKIKIWNPSDGGQGYVSSYGSQNIHSSSMPEGNLE